ncbi:retrotransposon gag family protein, partial [Staphylococcus aureus]
NRDAPRPRLGTTKDFMNLRPLEFYGIEGILYADEWLENVDRLLRMARVPEDLKIESASMQLFDITQTWYRDEPQLSAPGVTWAEFKELYKKKFYPDVAREALESQFESLEQGNLTVDEYTAEFSRLSRFAESMVSTPESKARRFRKGLTHEIRLAVATSRATTYEDILKVAQVVEKELDRRPKRDRDAYGGGSSQSSSAKRSNIPEKTTAPPGGPERRLTTHQQPRAALYSDPELPTCHYCGKRGHVQKDCRRRLRICLRCGSEQHHIHNCPERRTEGPIPPLPTTQEGQASLQN